MPAGKLLLHERVRIRSYSVSHFLAFGLNFSEYVQFLRSSLSKYFIKFLSTPRGPAKEIATKIRKIFGINSSSHVK